MYVPRSKELQKNIHQVLDYCYSVSHDPSYIDYLISKFDEYPLESVAIVKSILHDQNNNIVKENERK